jgi:hypothetical protein
MSDRAVGLNPTSPVMADAGTSVISVPARTAKRLVERRFTGARTAAAACGKITATVRPRIHPWILAMVFLMVITWANLKPDAQGC